jgi:peptide-N4-(N-acetyl-beta-glucosaminyl)asparagine amidase
LLQLLRWFKEEFFTWFDRPDCQRCRTAMSLSTSVPPTRHERESGDAHRVELYR